MRHICLTIAYHGSAYAGWQIQPQVPTIQGIIETQLQQMTKQPCRLRAAGRTDAGVHALGQVATFYTASSIPLRGFHRGLNALLPGDISILAADEVPLSFDVRRHNQGKHYRYTIWNQRTASPFFQQTAYQIYRPLNLERLAQASRAFVGTHDFSAFRAVNCQRKTTVRTIHRCSVSQEAPLVHIDVEGTAFLKNMVRIMAGTLIEVGQEHRAPESVAQLLRAGQRSQAGLTAPAHGLCLVQVFV